MAEYNETQIQYQRISDAQTSNYREAADKLFEAMDIITSKRISSIGFDKTLVCTIEEVIDSKKGIYRVTDGVSHFQAFTNNDISYKKEQKVYVMVPSGDMNNQKIITGRYVSKSENSVPYISPLDNFIDITNNIINNFDTQFTLKANRENEERKIYKYRYLTKTYKQAVDIKKMYYQYPPPDDNGKPINNVKWQIFPITRKEVIRGIWREDPF